MIIPQRARTVAGRWRRALRARQNERTVEERIVWILGSPRSGSTWLLDLLAENPAVVPINEPLIGWYLSPFLSDLPGWDSNTLDVTNFTLRRVQADQAQQFFANEFSDVWAPSLAQMMRRRFAAHAVRYPPPGRSPSSAVLAIKEPAGSQSADVLSRCLPQSRLMFLLRDGRDVVDSDLAANLKGSWVEREFPGASGVPEADRLAFVQQSARKWLWRTEVVQEAYAKHPGPRHMISYEQLLADPIEHLEAIFTWMCAELDRRVIDDLVERHSFNRVPEADRGDKSFFRAASPGLWKENLSSVEQEAVEEIIGPKLSELGYTNDR